MSTRDNPVGRIARRMVDIAEQWFPDAYLFVLVTVVAVAA